MTSYLFNCCHMTYSDRFDDLLCLSAIAFEEGEEEEHIIFI